MIIRVITRRREPSRTETTKILTDVPHNNYADVEKVRPSIRRQEPFLLLILSAFESHASNSSVWAFAPSSVSDQVFLCVENLHHSLRPRELMKSSYFFPHSHRSNPVHSNYTDCISHLFSFLGPFWFSSCLL